jgi:hypothetical protein
MPPVAEPPEQRRGRAERHSSSAVTGTAPVRCRTGLPATEWVGRRVSSPSASNGTAAPGRAPANSAIRRVVPAGSATRSSYRTRR